MFDYDATGVEPSTQGMNKPIVRGWYKWRIIEFVTNGGERYPREGYTQKNNYPKVDVMLECLSDGEFEGERAFHTITFMPKGKDGAGMAIHFLKSIGMPFEGKLTPNCEEWIDAEFMGYAVPETYNGKVRTKITEIKPIEDAVSAAMDAQALETTDDKLPF